MIPDSSIKVKTNPSNYKHYKNLGYIINKCGEEIIIKTIHLPTSSHVKVNCKCDNCGISKYIPYFNYNIFISKHGIYTCYKCCNVKNKLTCFQKYGKFYSATEDYRNKVNTTIVEKYGSEEEYSNFIRKVSKEKCIEKYGVDNVFQLENIKDKIKQTLGERYGVEHALQSVEFFNKSQKNGLKVKRYNGVNYQGSFELDFLKFCEQKNIMVKKHKSIDYKYNDSIRKYFPDFYLPEYNLIVEIKSSYYYQKELDRNLLKEEYSKKSGFDFIFIIDKNYDELSKKFNF
jgi:hypothetical protein